MTSVTNNSAGRDGREPDLFASSESSAPIGESVENMVEVHMNEGSTFVSPDGSMAFGARLRAAREARGLTVESCGQALRLPSRLLRQLEMGEYGGIDYQVYLAGYLTKYGRHVGVDETALEGELARITPRQPTLVVSGGISHSRYLLERYATAATYVVLTAVIVVPMVWLGIRGTLDRDMARLSPLDATPVAQQDAPASTSTSSAPPTVVSPVATHDDQPLLASMAVFPPLDSELRAARVAVPVPVAAVPVAGAHSLTLSLPAASWVEVTSTDGSRLEYGLLPAGTEKTYQSSAPLEVRIGNAGAATVKVDGQPVPLDAFRRANVARFRLDIKDGQATPVNN
jgi:cytoskeleton protein RodZ